MNQTKIGSFIEALVNTVIGYFIALISQILIFPIFDIHVPISTNLKSCSSNEYGTKHFIVIQSRRAPADWELPRRTSVMIGHCRSGCANHQRNSRPGLFLKISTSSLYSNTCS